MPRRKPLPLCFKPGTLVFLILAGLVGCADEPMPLDPETADMGGPLTANESATDVTAYDLVLEVLPDTRELSGIGTATVRAVKDIEFIELQLDARFDVPEVTVDGRPAAFERDRGVIRVALPEMLGVGETTDVAVTYRGKPWVAREAPWDGGIVWATSEGGHPWVATAVQGPGCDLWWPCKDHFADKPDRVSFEVTLPEELSAALNGKLINVKQLTDGRKTYFWRLDVPVSDYNIALNVGNFVRIQESYDGINGTTIPLEFWALAEHADNVRRLIDEDLVDQITWFEERLGPYPWGDEKLGFVETPYLGMEHQTINGYGNGFRNDPLGFDSLLQHELSHEWFGNFATHSSLAHVWIHEGFGAYMQPAYALDRFGEAAYDFAMVNTYLGIANCAPVVAHEDVGADDAFQGDVYGKGAFTLHTVRWLIGEEAFWRATRRVLYDTPEPWDLPYPMTPRTRSTDEVVKIFSDEAGRDLSWLFDVYLRETDLPDLAVEHGRETLNLSWHVPGGRPFPMPVPVRLNGVDTIVDMPGGAATVDLAPDSDVVIDPKMKVLRRLPILRTCEEVEAERAARHRHEGDGD